MQTSVTRRNGLKICWRLSLRGRRKWRLEVDMSPVDRHRAGGFGDCYCRGPVRRSVFQSPVCMMRCSVALLYGVLGFWTELGRIVDTFFMSGRLCFCVGIT